MARIGKDMAPPGAVVEWLVHAGFAAALVILGAIGTRSYLSLLGLVEAQASVQHSHEVIDGLKDLMAEITDVESSARGFTLVGKEIYLEPYFAARENVGKTMRGLRQSAAGNDRQTRQLDAIEALVVQKLDYHARVIDLRRRSGMAEPAELFMSGRGQELMRQIRGLIRAATGEEAAVLNSWTSDAQHDGRLTRQAILIGAVLSFSTLAVVYFRLIRQVRARRASAHRLLRLNRLYSTLSHIGQSIVRSRDRSTLFRETCRTAVTDGGLRMAWIGELGAQGQVIPVAHWGHEDGYLAKVLISVSGGPRSLGPTAKAIVTGTRLICSNIAEDPRMQPWRDEALRRGYRSSAAFPILLGGRILGALTVYASEPGFFDPEIVGLFDEIASNLAFAVENIEHEADRLAKERSLRESERRFRQIADNIEEVFWIANADFSAMLYVSPVFGRIWGRPCESPTIEDFLAGIHAEERSAVETTWRAAAAARTDWSREFRIVRPDGATRWVWARAVLVRGEDERPVGYAGVTEDVTERRQAEESLRELNQQLEERVQERTAELAEANRKLVERNAAVERANQMKSRFLARVSHEFRTPLNAIVGYSDLLREEAGGPLGEVYRRFVRNIQEGAQHLTELVNDLMDLSRIEAGRIELSPEAVDVAAALRDVLSVITPLAQAKSIRLENRVPDGTAVVADRVRLKQILYNLVSNAVKFTPEEGRVWVETQPGGDALTIIVGDTGIGIPAAEREAIFDEFHQVAPAPGHAAAGAGLGLAITRKLAELHGGSIHVESETGKGSTFFVSLPAAGRPVGATAMESHA